MTKRDEKLNYLNKLIFEKNIIAIVKFSVVTTIYVYCLPISIQRFGKSVVIVNLRFLHCRKRSFSILLFLVFGLNRCTIADKCFCSVQIRGNTEQEKSLFVSFIHNMKEH